MFLMQLNHPDFDKFPLALRGGGVSCGPEVTQQVIDRMGMRGVTQAYGLSEASPNVCMSYYTDDLDKRINGWAHILDDVEVRVVDPDSGADLAPGAPGEILVRGWSVMKGYYKMPEQTARPSIRQLAAYGDLGVMDDEGRLRFLTPSRRVPRRRRERRARRVEDVLHRHPKISRRRDRVPTRG